MDFFCPILFDKYQLKTKYTYGLTLNFKLKKIS